MEQESMLESNIRRIVREIQQGRNTYDLTDRERKDIFWLDGVNICPYLHSPDESPIVGSLTLREVRYAQAVSRAVRALEV